MQTSETYDAGEVRVQHAPARSGKEGSVRGLVLLLGLFTGSFSVMGATMPNGADNFYTSDRVTVQ
jgi:hypothetical protein